MIKKSILFFLILSLVTAFVSGCSKTTSGQGEVAGNDKKGTVYTSFYPMYDFTRKIGGDKVNIINLVPPGTEPHDWEPSAKDIAGLGSADLFIYNGAGMEGWVEKILKAANNPNLVAVEASRGLISQDNPALKNDPHLWLNPMLAKKQMEAVSKALAAVDPANKEYYKNNFDKNAKKLDSLHNKFKESAAGFRKRDIVVTHQAFGYLADAYGLNQVAIEGLNADAEPTPARMAEIVKFIKEKEIKYIFFEELISPKIADALAREVGAKTLVLDPFEGPKEDGIGADYFSVMEKNLEALKKALN